MEIEFARMRQGMLYDALQFLQVYVIVLNPKDKIVKIGFQASIHLAERNTVGISHVNIQISKLPNGNGSQFVSFWQGDMTGVPCNPSLCLLQFHLLQPDLRRVFVCSNPVDKLPADGFVAFSKLR